MTRICRPFADSSIAATACGRTTATSTRQWGIVSTNDTVYFAWQDSRNGTNDGSAEDSYFASVRLNEKKSSGVPRPVLVAASLAGGMGITMLLVLGLSRRGGSAKRNPLPQG